MEKIWGHIFTYELIVAPEEQNVLITDSSYKPKENREKIAQIMFETFGVNGLYIDNPADKNWREKTFLSVKCQICNILFK